MEYYSVRSKALLKQRLIASRGIYFPGIGLTPACPICGQAILKDADLHEALLTRGDTAGHARQELIFSAYNCVVVHHRCHMQIIGHGWDENFQKCARNLAQWEGYDAVRDWLQSMKEHFPHLAGMALNRFSAIDLHA